MPAAFAYLAAAFVLVAVALLPLASALLMALVPRLRPLAKRIALGVPGSAVGMLVFQVMALPVAMAIVWTFAFPVFYFHGSGGLTANLLIILPTLGGLFAAVAFFGTASLGGLVLGWRMANALGRHIPLRAFLASDEIWQVASAAFRRPYRLPLPLWLVTPFAFGVGCLMSIKSVTIADAPGAYRGALDSTHAFNIKADGSWTYRLEGQSHGAAAGTWWYEPGESDSASMAISFRVEAPAAVPEGTPLRQPGLVLGYVARDCFGRLSVCFGVDSQICYRRSVTGEKGAARGTRDRPRALRMFAPTCA